MFLNKLTFFLFLMLLGIGTPVWSDPISVSVELQSIEVVKTSEKGGDELYIDITQYSNLGESKIDRIPEAPLHWVSSQLDQIKNVPLWKGTIRDNEEMKLFISVVEQDNPPIDVDDLIGTALVMLKNDRGHLKTNFDLPVFEDRANQKTHAGQDPREFIMQGDNSNYKVVLKVNQIP